MPIYEYRCRKCGAHAEKIRKFSDPPLTTCETCGGELEQLLSSPAIQFKGSGWYVTDYARKSSPPESGKAEGAATGEGKKPSETSAKTASRESKPATD